MRELMPIDESITVLTTHQNGIITQDSDDISNARYTLDRLAPDWMWQLNEVGFWIIYIPTLETAND